MRLGMSLKFLKPKEVADYLQITTRTLANKRALGNGPPFLRTERTIRYPISGLDRYVNSHMHHNTRKKRYE